MKRFAAIALALLLTASVPALAAEGTAASAAVEVNAPSAVLMEQVTGTVLYAKDESARRAPASVTKIMTLLLAAEAIDSGALSLDDTVTASAGQRAWAAARSGWSRASR